MPSRPVQVLIPAWGKPYITLLTDFALPSLLSPGNLPAVPADYTVTFVFLTCESDVSLIKATDAFSRLSHLAAVKFISIDDLIVPTMSGLSLTRAYAHGIIELGNSATDTIFVLFNADFIISNGGLPRAIELCDRHTAVLAPSLRCNDETRTALMAELRADAGAATHARALVRMTLENLHPTVLANFVTQQAVHHAATHQLFWRVDDATLLGHFGLLFPLAFRPSVPLERVQGFCDYTFIPMMCPGIDPFIVADSDDIYLLELQRRDHEIHYLRFGHWDNDDLAQALGSWMTLQHRKAFTTPILIHCDDIPKHTVGIARDAGTWIKHLVCRMPRMPQPYVAHPYWNGAVATLRHCPDLQAPRESETHKAKAQRHMIAMLWALYRFVAGTPPEVRPFHLKYVDYCHIRARANELLAEHPRRLFYITDMDNDMDDWITEHFPGSTRTLISGLWDGESDKQNGEPFDAAFAYLQSSNISRLAELVKRLGPHLRPNAKIVLAFHDHCWAQYGVTLDHQIMLDLGHIIPLHIPMQLSIRGGVLRRLVHYGLVTTAANMILQPSLARRFLAICKIGVLLAIMTAINVTHWLRRPSFISTSSIIFSYRL